MAEIITSSYKLFDQASLEEDPGKRLALTVTGILASFNQMKVRKKKPFNPMLGETFEMVTEEFRFIGEKVQHIPKQISAYYMEGKHYKLTGYNKPKP